jgi:hypothetical protein
MARHDAGPESKKLYRAVIKYRLWNRYKNDWQPYEKFYGPYTKKGPAKSIITREVSVMETSNYRHRLIGELQPYDDIKFYVEETVLNWIPVI